MATMSSALFQPHLADAKVDLVIENKDIASGDFVETGNFGDRQAGFVHEALRLYQKHLFLANSSIGNQRA